MGPIDCAETLVRNYYYSLRNNPEERSSLHGFNFATVSRVSGNLPVTVAFLKGIVNWRSYEGGKGTRDVVVRSPCFWRE